MSKSKDLEIYIRIVVDREYLKNHSFSECARAFSDQLVMLSTEAARQAALKIANFKKKGRF